MSLVSAPAEGESASPSLPPSREAAQLWPGDLQTELARIAAEHRAAALTCSHRELERRLLDAEAQAADKERVIAALNETLCARDKVIEALEDEVAANEVTAQSRVVSPWSTSPQD
jgi:uncharacterized coiled-coil protein SlyX